MLPGTTGYGSAATPLLSTTVTSGGDGMFSITGLYSCPSPSALVYIVATGGNPGLALGTSNSALALMTALGPCGNLNASTSIQIDELTTVASVQALAQFMAPGGGINLGTSSTNIQGLSNAFATVNNLVNTATGTTPGPNLPPGAIVPTSKLNTLADILAPCVNSSGNTGECGDLFALTTPNGGLTPTNTIDAALNIALNPGNNASALYSLIAGVLPFQPILSTAPNTWSVNLNYKAQQALSGATIQLYAAGTTGYGSAATPLLSTTVTSGGDGMFSITGLYSCPSPSALVYIVATGGNPGLALGTSNSALALMTALGPCGNLNASTSIQIDELTTVASVQALAQFMAPGGGINLGTSSTNIQGLSNAFATVNNLVNTATGTTPGPNLPPGAIVPTSKLKTLADILAPCVNSSGNTGECSDLFALTTPNGGLISTNTIDAALNIALNPGNNVTALYDSITGVPPFQSMLSSAPNDWTLILTYRGGGLDWISDIAIDSVGNVWATNHMGNSISKFSNSGVALSPSGGYSGGGLGGSGPDKIAVDSADNVWVTNTGSSDVPAPINVVSEFSSTGSAISPSTGYTGGGLTYPRGIAVDANSSVWVVNTVVSSITEFSSAGSAISPSAGYTGAGLHFPIVIAVDGEGYIWAAGGSPSISKFSSTGTAISPSTGYTGGGLGSSSYGIAVDASGNVWIANYDSNSVSEFANDGTPISPSTGYTGAGVSRPTDIAVDGLGDIWVVNWDHSISKFSNNGVPLSAPTGYTADGLSNDFMAGAIDASGNIWVGSRFTNTLVEFVSAAAPVMTPLAAAVKNNKFGTRP